MARVEMDYNLKVVSNFLPFCRFVLGKKSTYFVICSWCLGIYFKRSHVKYPSYTYVTPVTTLVRYEHESFKKTFFLKQKRKTVEVKIQKQAEV